MASEHLMNTLDFAPITFVKGRGSYLVTAAGAEYLDFFCDVGTAPLGYAPPESKRVLSRMLANNVPAHQPNLFGSEARDLAADTLCRLTEMDKVFFCNSGAESVEAAIKLARLYQHRRWEKMDNPAIVKRTEIWTPFGGFHGRTLATLAAGDGPKYHNEGFGPFPAGFRHFATLGDVEEAADYAAAILLAPVFGNNDVQEYPDDWLDNLVEFAHARNILVIFDEVQTGSGRSGHYTYAQKLGLKPDIITLGKGVGMGAPVGACLARGEVAGTFTPGTHFSTFGGNPLSAEHVIEMWRWLETAANYQRADGIGDWLKGVLKGEAWAKNVRGPGALLAFDVEFDAKEFARECRERGLLIGAFRSGPGPVKITPPLNIGIKDLQKGALIMKEAARALHT